MKPEMTIGELKRQIEEYPDDTLVAIRDNTVYLNSNFEAIAHTNEYGDTVVVMEKDY